MPKFRLMPAGLLFLLFSTVAIGAPRPVVGQVDIDSRMPVKGIVFGGRVNTQLSTTSVDGEVDWQWNLRRARLYFGAQINDWLDGVAQVDWAGERAEGRLLFLRGTFSPHLRVSIGQFKRAFDLFELTSSSMILVVERAGRVRGIDSCAGVGGMCTYSRFTEALQLSSLDIGLLLEGAFAADRGEYRVTLTNGAGRNRGDENDSKSFAARLAYRVRSDLMIGTNLGVHDFPNPVTGLDAHAPAFAVDLEWGNYEGGPHVQAGVLFGENWRKLDDAGEAGDFLAWQGIATYRARVRDNRYVQALEPVLRLSFGDPDRSSAADGGWLLTPGFVAHFDGRNKIAANVDRWSPESGDHAWGLLVQTYFYF